MRNLIYLVGFLALGAQMVSVGTAQEDAPVKTTSQPQWQRSGEAAPVVTRRVSPPIDRTAIIEKASRALSGVFSAQGEFVQLAPDGTVSEGKFYIRRPGRMRFEYHGAGEEAVPLLIVADGSTVAIEDRILETIDRVPLSSTPLGLILKRNVDMSRDARVLSVREENGRTAIRISDKSGEAEGELTLVFEGEEYKLSEWYVTDAQNQLTHIRLFNVHEGGRLNPRLFIIEEDERGGRGRG